MAKAWIVRCKRVDLSMKSVYISSGKKKKRKNKKQLCIPSAPPTPQNYRTSTGLRPSSAFFFLFNSINLNSLYICIIKEGLSAGAKWVYLLGQSDDKSLPTQRKKQEKEKEKLDISVCNSSKLKQTTWNLRNYYLLFIIIIIWLHKNSRAHVLTPHTKVPNRPTAGTLQYSTFAEPVIPSM